MATQTLDGAAPPDRGAEPRRTAWRQRLPKLVFLRRLVSHVVEDDVPDLGAMMAYYAVLALFPMLVFVVTLALLVIDPGTIHQGVLMATQTLPEDTRQLISTQVSGLIDAADAGFAIGSFVFALWGASRGTAALGTALNKINACSERRPWWKRQAIAIGVTAGIALMIVVALGILVVGPPLGHYVADRFGLGGTFDVIWEIGRWVGAALLVMIVWAVAYHFLPCTNTPFRVFTLGAFAGIAMWVAISYAFNLYLGSFASYETTYGALGGAIIFLTWLWLSNIALLVGAEINEVVLELRRERAEAFLAEQTVRDLNRSDT